MICEPLSGDLGTLAEIYEEYHLLSCRTHPELFCPPFEDSYYFNELSNILLYSDDEMIISVDEETDFVKGFAVFAFNLFNNYFSVINPGSVIAVLEDCKINFAPCRNISVIIRRRPADKIVVINYYVMPELEI